MGTEAWGVRAEVAQPGADGNGPGLRDCMSSDPTVSAPGPTQAWCVPEQLPAGGPHQLQDPSLHNQTPQNPPLPTVSQR